MAGVRNALAAAVFLVCETAFASAPVERFIASYPSLLEQGPLVVEDNSRKVFDQIAKISPASLKDDELRCLFHALNIVSGHVTDPAPARSLMQTADELSRRKLISPVQIETVLDVLSTARLNGEATAYAQQHGLQADNLDAAGVRSLQRAVINFSGKSATAESFAFPPGGFVLVVGLPSCQFAENAAIDISKDQRMEKAMSTVSRWIVPQTRGTSTSEIAEWNKSHSAFNYSVMWSQNQWPEMRDWASPTFYFFRDGKLVDQLVGWRRPEAPALLEQKLRAIGINVKR